MSKIRILNQVVFLAALSLMMAGQAAANLITNPSFEDGDYNQGPFNRLDPGSTRLTGWVIGGYGIDWHNTEHISPAFEGEMVDLNTTGSGWETGTLSQTFTTTPGAWYTLTFAMAGPGTGFPNPRYVQVEIAGVTRIFSQEASNNLNMVWGLKSMNFQALMATTTLTFSSVNGYGFWGPVIDSVAVEPFAEPITIDIKPGSCPNPLNVKSKGVLPVAVLGTEDFDVLTIDPATIRLSLEGMEVGVAPIRWSYEDVGTPFEGELCGCHALNGDGYIDLSLKFDIKALITTLELGGIIGNTLPLTITGNLKEEFGGTPIQGQDCIWVLK
jgi:choice-of-anchor C domain-containing protein